MSIDEEEFLALVNDVLLSPRLSSHQRPIDNAVPAIIVEDENKYARFEPFRYCEERPYRVYCCPFFDCRHRTVPKTNRTERNMYDALKRHIRKLHKNDTLVVNMDFLNRFRGDDTNIKLFPIGYDRKTNKFVDLVDGLEKRYYIIIEKWFAVQPKETTKRAKKRKPQEVKKRKTDESAVVMYNKKMKDGCTLQCEADLFGNLFKILKFRSLEEIVMETSCDLNILLDNYPMCQLFTLLLTERPMWPSFIFTIYTHCQDIGESRKAIVKMVYDCTKSVLMITRGDEETKYDLWYYPSYFSEGQLPRELLYFFGLRFIMQKSFVRTINFFEAVEFLNF
jgi:hypothetical protein